MITQDGKEFIAVKCKAFSRCGVYAYAIHVDNYGRVWVWDDVARNFTTCHDLSDRTQRRIVKLWNQRKG